ncbi:hypothetical protein EK21DRAFT_59937, partial [Setomelanomma holmii]
AGQDPDWQPRRLWSEALRASVPRLRVLALHIAKVGIHFTYFQLSLQLLVTIAQTLGIHFHAGSDVVGLFPRYWANLTSTENLFGVVGKDVLKGHVEFVAGWWWDWVFGLTSLLIWHFPKALLRGVWRAVVMAMAIPGKKVAGGAWGEIFVSKVK